MFQVVSSQCIFGTQGEGSPSLLLEEIKPLVSWSGEESHHLTLNLLLELWTDLFEGCFAYNLPCHTVGAVPGCALEITPGCCWSCAAPVSGSSGHGPCWELISCLVGGNSCASLAIVPASWMASLAAVLTSWAREWTEFQESGNVECFSFSILTCSYFALDTCYNSISFFGVSILIFLPKCSWSTKLVISQHSFSESLKGFFNPSQSILSQPNVPFKLYL